jgi:transposase
MVKAAFRGATAPKYERSARGWVVDAFEPRIRELLRPYPRWSATVIAERIDWPHGMQTLSGEVAELRPFYLPPDPASRTTYDDDEIAQCDFWLTDIELPVGFGQTRTAKGLVERFHDYLERSFLPGRVFTSPTDFNTQLKQWLIKANSRHHRRLGCRVVDRVDADKAAILALPPVAPITGWHKSLRLPRDRCIRFDSNDYSVRP